MVVNPVEVEVETEVELVELAKILGTHWWWDTAQSLALAVVVSSSTWAFCYPSR